MDNGGGSNRYICEDVTYVRVVLEVGRGGEEVPKRKIRRRKENGEKFPWSDVWVVPSLRKSHAILTKVIPIRDAVPSPRGVDDDDAPSRDKYKRPKLPRAPHSWVPTKGDYEDDNMEEEDDASNESLSVSFGHYYIPWFQRGGKLRVSITTKTTPSETEYILTIHDYISPPVPHPLLLSVSSYLSTNPPILEEGGKKKKKKKKKEEEKYVVGRIRKSSGLAMEKDGGDGYAVVEMVDADFFANNKDYFDGEGGRKSIGVDVEEEKRKEGKIEVVMFLKKFNPDAKPFEEVSILQPGYLAWFKLKGWRNWKGVGRTVMQRVDGEFGVLLGHDEDEDGEVNRRKGWGAVERVNRKGSDWLEVSDTRTGEKVEVYSRLGNQKIHRVGELVCLDRTWFVDSGNSDAKKGMLDVGSGGWGRGRGGWETKISGRGKVWRRLLSNDDDIDMENASPVTERDFWSEWTNGWSYYLPPHSIISNLKLQPTITGRALKRTWVRAAVKCIRGKGVKGDVETAGFEGVWKVRGRMVRTEVGGLWLKWTDGGGCKVLNMSKWHGYDDANVEEGGEKVYKITNLRWCWVAVDEIHVNERGNEIVSEVKDGVIATVKGNTVWAGVVGGWVEGLQGERGEEIVGRGLEDFIKMGRENKENFSSSSVPFVSLFLESIHGSLNESGYVDCRWVGNEGYKEVGKVYYRVECREEEVGGGEEDEWEGIKDEADEDDWIGEGRGNLWGDSNDDYELEDVEDDGDGVVGGGGAMKRKNINPLEFCAIWVAPAKQLSTASIKSWGEQYGTVVDVVKKEGATFAIVTFQDARVGDFVMKVQRIKNMRIKEEEKMRKMNGNAYGGGAGGRTDWTCGLCCNFNFKSKDVCNRQGCEMTQVDNVATYPNFERSDWKCHACDNNNFKSRAVCYSYGCEVTQGQAWLEAQKSKKPGFKVGRVLSEYKDWTCTKCGHFNFKSKTICFVTGCDMTQERNREIEQGDGGEESDDTDVDDDDLGRVWEGGHRIEGDQVDCRYVEGGAWKERRRKRKEKRKIRLKFKEKEMSRVKKGKVKEPMKVLVDAIRKESWGNAFFGVCKGHWKPTITEVKGWIEGGENVIVLEGKGKGGGRWICDVVGERDREDKGNAQTLGFWTKGKGKRVEVRDLRKVGKGRVVETRTKVGNVEKVRCRGLCGNCGEEIKERNKGGRLDEIEEDEEEEEGDDGYEDKGYFKRPLPKGGQGENWGPKEWGNMKEFMSMPMSSLASLPNCVVASTMRYSEGRKNWRTFRKCKNGCSPVFWGWSWEVEGKFDDGWGAAIFKAEGEAGRRIMSDMGVNVERVERGGGALFMQTKPLSKEIVEIVKTQGGMTNRGQVRKLLTRKQIAEYELYMSCKNNAVMRSGKNALLKEGRVYFISLEEESDEVVTIEVDVTKGEVDRRGLRICGKERSMGRSLPCVRIVGWREEKKGELIANALKELGFGDDE